MIKFPTTLKEYTHGKMWHSGVETSIAQRIIAGYDRVEDEGERNDRKMYIAHYFSKIGNYPAAIEIVSQMLMEGVYVDESIELLRQLSILDEDIESFQQVLRISGENVSNIMHRWIFDSMLLKLPKSLEKDHYVTKNGYVVSAHGRDYYYKNGKMIFSVVNRDYTAYLEELSVRFYLNSNQFDKALALLKKIKLEGTTLDMQLLCYKSFVEVYCELHEYAKAYEYCKKLIENDIYTPYIADVFYSLYMDGSPDANVLKEFFISHKGYSLKDLCDMHSLSGELASGEEFWAKVYANNPIRKEDTSECAYLLRGMMYFNDGEYKLAEREFAHMASSCGNFGKGGLLLQYMQYYKKYLKKPTKRGEMPDKIYSVNLVWISEFVGKKLMKKLKQVASMDEFMQDAEENVLGLQSMLYVSETKLSSVFEIVHNLYNTGCLAVRDMINRIAVSSEYNLFVRSICLAEYLMNCDKKTLIVMGGKFKNYALRYKKDGKKDNLAYGIAIFCAFAMLTGFDKDEIEVQIDLFDKIYEVIDIDYSAINPCAIFSLLFSYVSDSDKLSFVGIMTKKREAQELIYDILSGWHTDFDTQLDKDLDEDVYNFILKCGYYV